MIRITVDEVIIQSMDECYWNEELLHCLKLNSTCLWRIRDTSNSEIGFCIMRIGIVLNQFPLQKRIEIRDIWTDLIVQDIE